MWDIDSAVLITHSIPKFPVGPQMNSEYIGLLENAWDYGQSMTCIEFSLSALEIAFNSLDVEIPLIYEESIKHNISNSETHSVYNISNIVCDIQQLDSKYMIFVKSSSEEVDIWSDCIGAYFETNMQVESWVHGELEGSYCPPYTQFETVDIKSINFGDGNEFIEYDDHSKWGLGANPLVCFGDMNRIITQKERGGSTYCWKDATLWENINTIINSTSVC
jgi:deoxyribonuclease-2